MANRQKIAVAMFAVPIAAMYGWLFWQHPMFILWVVGTLAYIGAAVWLAVGGIR